MELTIFAGKGGVGKSTSAAAYAMHRATRRTTLLADYDGGHSLPRVLALDDKEYAPNLIYPTDIPHLNIAIIDQSPFKGILDTKQDGKTIREYLLQFKGDFGLVPFCDMITSFFGVPTDVDSASKFVSLIDIYHKAKEKSTSSIVIDVEPTAGLERLLSSVSSITRSIQNLQRTGWLTLQGLKAKWPDIAQYLKGEYIKNGELYAKRMEEVAWAIKNAGYFLVTIPEKSPIDQMGDVERMISSFGGNILGYVVNNIRGEPHEAEQLTRVEAGIKKKPVIKISHNEKLCDADKNSRRQALKESGKLFANL